VSKPTPRDAAPPSRSFSALQSRRTHLFRQVQVRPCGALGIPERPIRIVRHYRYVGPLHIPRNKSAPLGLNEPKQREMDTLIAPLQPVIAATEQVQPSGLSTSTRKSC